MKTNKNYRILRLYVWLDEGKCINPVQAAQEFQVTMRTIQRDIADIKAFLAEERVESGRDRRLIYDRQEEGYRIQPTPAAIH